MFKKVLFIVALMSFVASASATYYYDNATGDGLWTTPGNWANEQTLTPQSDRTYTLTAAPTTADRVYIGGGHLASEGDIKLVVQAADTIVATGGKTRWGFSGSTTSVGTTSMEIYGSLTINVATTWAQNCDTSILVDGGLLDCAGTGQYNAKATMNIINGGVVTAGPNPLQLSNAFGAGGYVDLLNVDDGLFTAGGLDVGDALYAFYGIDIVVGADGTIVFDDTDASVLALAQQLYLVDGILQSGVAGEGLRILWDGATTTITVPEPATIALLGLGGLLLRKRR